MIRRVAFMIAFFGNLCRMTMPVLQTGIPAFIPTVKGRLAWISQPSDYCMHRYQPFIRFQRYFILFLRIHSVVSLFSESNFLPAPPHRETSEQYRIQLTAFLRCCLLQAWERIEIPGSKPHSSAGCAPPAILRFFVRSHRD